jgi:hypothetical protein
VHLVLHDGEEDLCFPLCLHVIGGQREDLPDAGQQFIEVVGQSIAALQPVVIQCETLDQVFAQTFSRPLAELHALERPHPVADSQDHVEIAELDLAAYAASTFLSNL